MRFRTLEGPLVNSTSFPHNVTVNGHTSATVHADAGYGGRYNLNGLFSFDDGQALSTMRTYRSIGNRAAISRATDKSVEVVLSSNLKSGEWQWPDGSKFVKSRTVMSQVHPDKKLDSETRPETAYAVWVDHELGVALPMTDMWGTAFGPSGVHYADYRDKSVLPTSGALFWPVVFDKHADTGMVPIERWVETALEWAEVGTVFMAMGGEKHDNLPYKNLAAVAVNNHVLNATKNPRPWIGVEQTASEAASIELKDLTDMSMSSGFKRSQCFRHVVSNLGSAIRDDREVDSPTAYVLAAYVSYLRAAHGPSFNIPVHLRAAAKGEPLDIPAHFRWLYRELEKPLKIKKTNPFTHLVKKV